MVKGTKGEEYILVDILTSIMDFVYLKNPDEKLLAANNYAQELFGLNEVQWVGKKAYELANLLSYSTLFHVNSEVTDEQVWKNRMVTQYEKEIYNYGEGFKTFSIIKMPLYFENGNKKALLVMGKDITLEKNNQNKLTNTIKELADFKYALDQSSIVATTDYRGRITYVNDTFCEISKYTREELIGKDHRILNSGHHSKQFFKNMWESIKAGECWKGEIKNKAKDGSFYWVKTTIIPFTNAEGVPYQYIAIRQDITEQKLNEERIYYNAYYDELTGLRNRRYFRKEISQRITDNTSKTAFMFLDLNRFKYINDTLGHSIGDKILQSVSKRLLKHLDGKADLYRFGGDEFIIVCKYTFIAEVESFIEGLISLFSAPVYLNKEVIYLNTSVGVSLFPEDGKDTETLIKKADSAMYIAKKKGNNKVQFYTDDLYENSNRNLKIESALRHAIEFNEFVLHYQPQVDLRSKEIIGVEALLRWEHPTLGNIPPSEFIPIAEETGLIFPISEWVLETACKQHYQLQKSSFSRIRIGINISAVLISDTLVSMVNRILKKTQLEPRYLELEITESVMQDSEVAIPILQDLKSLGIRLSIDDFGTGYSSLAYIRDFPIDSLKIDRGFIEQITNDNGAIVKMIITMASLLKVNVIAEGIETNKQLDFLIQTGCDEGQGYLFNRPLPYSEIKRILVKEMKLLV